MAMAALLPRGLSIRARAVFRTRQLLFRGFCAHVSDDDAQGRSIAVDRSGLLQHRAPTSGDTSHKTPRTPLLDVMEAIVSGRGPMSVADYMRRALTHPEHGYYMRRDVFGREGDFVTAPEVLSVFGELVGIWCVAMWQQLGEPEQLRIVELGPGRGTLMRDLLRITRKFEPFYGALTVHLCDASPALMKIQQQRIGCEAVSDKEAEEAAARLGVDLQQTPEAEAEASSLSSPRMPPLRSMRMPDAGPWVHWHNSFSDVPEDAPTLFVAQEFFDALPVYQFELTSRGWVERLVDVADAEDPHHLRFALSPGPTPATQALVLGRKTDVRVAVRALRDQIDQLRQVALEMDVDLGDEQRSGAAATTTPTAAPASSSTAAPSASAAPASETATADSSEPKTLADEAVGDRVEVCAEGMAVMQQLAERISRSTGAILAIDYGNDFAAQDSLRAISKHEFVHPLQSPGECDLTADVDFHMLRKTAMAAKPDIEAWGPVTQNEFLHNMGIGPRMAQLLKAHEHDEEAVERMIQAYHRLTDEDQMGSVYKVMAVVHNSAQWAPGFEEWHRHRQQS